MKLLCRPLIFLAAAFSAAAQDLPRRPDDPVPAQVDTMYDRGLAYLAKTQNDRGSWDDSMGSEPGVVGLCVVAFLAVKARNSSSSTSSEPIMSEKTSTPPGRRGWPAVSQ